MSLTTDSDTICAIATPPGKGGVGIVRVSGPLCQKIAFQLLRFNPLPRHAYYSRFLDSSDSLIDQGIVLFFQSPNSFTGEDVLELQGHGGSFVLDRLLKEVMRAGCRLARPGEFSERAFINDKLDLAQAEAIADLIEASSEEAARSAVRTLSGEFSHLIKNLSEKIIELRVYIEASIDFSDEEIDFLSEGNIEEKISALIKQTEQIIPRAKQGSILRDGMTVVIAGKPNAGKSSLLNALAERDTAIVTEIAGTTRDTLVEKINIDGMPLHIIDTAGLRRSEDVVEQEGIRRAVKAIKEADRILLVVDVTQDTVTSETISDYLRALSLDNALGDLPLERISLVLNKIDLSNEAAIHVESNDIATIRISAKSHLGLDLLKQHLKECMGYTPSGEGNFIARRRHLDALESARDSLIIAHTQLLGKREGELVAEDLKQAHRHLGTITGDFTTDELLGKIFASFCVGK